MKDKDQEGFLKDLAALTLKYGIEIGGCGCCGSPSLEETDAKAGQYSTDCGSCLSFIAGEVRNA